MNLSVPSEKPDLEHDFKLQTKAINILSIKTVVTSLKYLPVIAFFFGGGGVLVTEYILEQGDKTNEFRI
jgi:hypothetical protein